jgi:hypothetical protein
MLLHINPTRQRGKRTGSLARASGWYMTFFAAGVITVRRPAGLNSPATRSSAGFVMREIQTGLHKPEGGTKQRLTKSADNSAPVCFPNCASICLGSRVSFDLPLALANKSREEIEKSPAVPVIEPVSYGAMSPMKSRRVC